MGKSRVGDSILMIENSIFEFNEMIRDIYRLLLRTSRIVSHKRNIIVREKQRSDFVTNLDFAVEEFLISGLREIENIPCLTEETNQRVMLSSFWAIDPIDGTTNFIHGYPSYCISIAKVHAGITMYGFVFNLVTKELFVGIKGNGAYLWTSRAGRQRKIHVSDTTWIDDSLIGFGCPYDKNKTDRIFEITNRILKHCHDVKRNGPASLDLCYVACGRLDAYYEYDLKEWDYKAGKLILEEAGGKLTDWYGEDIFEGTSSIVASNGRIHTQVMEYLR